MDNETLEERSPVKSFLMMMATIAMILVGTFAVVYVASMLEQWFPDEPTPATSQTSAAEPEAQPTAISESEAMILVAEWLVREKLKDPDAAQFRRIVKVGPVACGEVNSKNGFGAYTGFERFIAAGTEATWLESEVAPGVMDEAWQKYCTPGPA